MRPDRLNRLSRGDLRAAARMCARAFRDAPHVAHFFPSADRQAADAECLFEVRLRFGWLYGDVQITSSELEGLAVWIPSEKAGMTPWQQLRSGGIRLTRAVGSDAVARMMQVADHNDRLRLEQVPAAHWVLSVLAVDPTHQHRGHATRLLEPMLRRLDREGIPAYAETTEQPLLGFYRRFGFEAGEASTVPGTDLVVWPLVRAPDHVPPDARRRRR